MLDNQTLSQMALSNVLSMAKLSARLDKMSEALAKLENEYSRPQQPERSRPPHHLSSGSKIVTLRRA